MADFDFSKLQNLSFDLPQININPAQEVIERMNRETEETFRIIEKARQDKESEELRRHNELVAALKEAGEKGATILIGDNANGIQIQQNSAGATQSMNNSEGLDYEQVQSVLKDIRGYFDFPQFRETFGENTDNVKSVVETTLASVENGENEGLVKKSLSVLRELAIGATGSLIASGILALLGTLPIG